MKKLVRILIVLAVSFLVALGVAELLVRANPGWMPEQAQIRMHWRELMVETHSVAHPHCGFTFKPNATGSMERGGDFRFTYHTDGNGFRNREPLPERAEVVTLGDSMTFSYGVADEEAWPVLVEEGLGEKRVVNLGLPGAGPEQYARIFETFGLGLAPELVVVGVLPANDVRDGKMFARWVDAGSRGNYDVWRFGGGGGGLKGLLERSYLFTWSVEAAKIRRSKGFYPAATLELPNGARMNLVPSLIANASKEAEPGHPDFERTLVSLERLIGLAEGAGCEVLFLLFPSKEESYLPGMGLPTPEPVAPFREAFAERGWPTLDLTPAFRAAAERQEQVFFEVDGHPNAAGYRIVAEEVLRRIGEGAARD